MENLAQLFYQAGIHTCYQIFFILGPGCLLGYYMHLISRQMERNFITLIGFKFYLWGVAGLGTVVHELGHAVMCVLFGHRIKDISFFNPNGKGGRVGHVQHSYSRGNPFQLIGNFFISIGPLISGTFVIFAANFFLLEGSAIVTSDFNAMITIKSSFLQSIQMVCRDLFSILKEYFTALIHTAHFSNWKFYLLLYVAFSVGSCLTLSAEDIKGAWRGFLSIMILWFLFNLGMIFLGVEFTSRSFFFLAGYIIPFYGMMGFILAFNALLLLPLHILTVLKK